MILSTYPGKIPQTSPKPPERNKFLHKPFVKGQGYLPGVCGWDLRYTFSSNAMELGGESSQQNNRPIRHSHISRLQSTWRIHPTDSRAFGVGKCYLKSLSVTKKSIKDLQTAINNIARVPLRMSIHQPLLGFLGAFTFKTHPDAVFWSLHGSSLVGFSGIIVLVQEVLCQSLTAWQNCV